MPAPPTIASVLASARKRIDAADAAVLLCHLLEKPRAYLYAWPEQPLSAAQTAAFEALVARRAEGEPVAYLTGEREFWSLSLRVTPATLIPRPETELLVELALERLPPDRDATVADLGTGSGAIALAIASERPRCRVVAVDRSAAALRVAQENGRRLGIGNVAYVQGEWLEPLAAARFCVIVANPPYVCAGDPHLGEGDVRFEPRSALVAGADGLDDLRRIVAAAGRHLEPGGWLLLEHGYDQGEAVAALLAAAGLREVEGYRDLAGQPRVTVGRMGAVG